MKKKKKNGGLPARIGVRFFKEIESIKDKRLKNGKSKDRVSTEKISNLIVRHKNWLELKNDIINAGQEEVEKHGLEE
jgi:hypothetical protein